MQRRESDDEEAICRRDRCARGNWAEPRNRSQRCHRRRCHHHQPGEGGVIGEGCGSHDGSQGPVGDELRQATSGHTSAGGRDPPARCAAPAVRQGGLGGQHVEQHPQLPEHGRLEAFEHVQTELYELVKGLVVGPPRSPGVQSPRSAWPGRGGCAQAPLPGLYKPCSRAHVDRSRRRRVSACGAGRWRQRWPRGRTS
jgi:hypothetical protein